MIGQFLWKKVHILNSVNISTNYFFSKIDSNYYLRNHGEILLRIYMMTKFGTDISPSEMSLLSLGPCETSKTTKSC